jgi:hypothetical protein
MTFDQKYQIYVEEYSISQLTAEEQNKLFNLVGSVYLKLKDKHTMIEVVDKLLSDNADAVSKPLRIPLAIHTLFLIEYCHFKPSPLGLVNAKDIKAEITRILDNWLPF